LESFEAEIETGRKVITVTAVAMTVAEYSYPSILTLREAQLV